MAVALITIFGMCCSFAMLLSCSARYGDQISFQNAAAQRSESAVFDAAWLSAARLELAALGNFHDPQSIKW